MAWKVSCIVDERLQFLSSYQKEEMSVTDLCHEYGISRPTACRWTNRYKAVGPEGLLDLSHGPHSCSHATPDAVVKQAFEFQYMTAGLTAYLDLATAEEHVFRKGDFYVIEPGEPHGC